MTPGRKYVLFELNGNMLGVLDKESKPRMPLNSAATASHCGRDCLSSSKHRRHCKHRGLHQAHHHSEGNSQDIRKCHCAHPQMLQMSGGYWNPWCAAPRRICWLCSRKASCCSHMLSCQRVVASLRTPGHPLAHLASFDIARCGAAAAHCNAGCILRTDLLPTTLIPSWAGWHPAGFGPANRMPPSSPLPRQLEGRRQAGG